MTLQELAQQAGVSVSTVSKALNNSPDISQQTRQMILDLAEQQGYQKKQRRKFSDKNGFPGPKIGLVYSDVVSRYYSRLIQAYNDKIIALGGVVIACDAQFSDQRQAALCNFLDQHCQVDGIISISAAKDLATIPKTRAPILCSVSDVATMPEHSSGSFPFDYIFTNARAGIHQALEYLIQCGHRDIAYISEPHSKSRQTLFEESAAQLGLSIPPSYWKLTPLRFEEAGYRMMQELLQEDRRPTAVLCAYDDIAIGAAKAIYEAGLRVPEDISLIGYDDTRQRIFNQKILASISSFVDDQVSIGVAMLLKRIAAPGSGAVQNVSLQTAFLPYETAGPCKSAK